LDYENDLCVPENTGQNGLYKTVLAFDQWIWRGRPFLGRAAIRSIDKQNENGRREAHHLQTHPTLYAEMSTPEFSGEVTR
jgi:hypothetical protein